MQDRPGAEEAVALAVLRHQQMPAGAKGLADHRGIVQADSAWTDAFHELVIGDELPCRWSQDRANALIIAAFVLTTVRRRPVCRGCHRAPTFRNKPRTGADIAAALPRAPPR